MNIAFNPNLTTNGLGGFNVETTGYIAGMAMDDPASRFYLAGGPLASTETLPMWGGLPIGVNIPAGTAGALALGGSVVRSLALSTMMGVSVFNQNHAMINSPQSPVPLAAPGMLVNYYRFGSLQRTGLPILASLASLIGSSELSQVSWDFYNNQLTTFQAAYAANVTTAASWAATNGGQATFTTTSAHGVAVGQYVFMSGFTPSGYNGLWLTVAGTTGSTIVVAMPVNPGAVSVEGTLVAGGGAFPGKILDMNIGNSMTVSYDPVTGFATWNRTGNVALVLI